MKITALELKYLQVQRETNSAALLQAHRDAHDLVCSNQDDNCSVTEEVAIQILTVLHKFARVCYNPETCEYYAISLLEPRGDDLVWLSLFFKPNAHGRFETCSASDNSSYYIQVES